jgi:hypothetical protein
MPCHAMPCNKTQNVGLERKRREGEVKKGCDLLLCRDFEFVGKVCRIILEPSYMGHKDAKRQGQISLGRNADTKGSNSVVKPWEIKVD